MNLEEIENGGWFELKAVLLIKPAKSYTASGKDNEIMVSWYGKKYKLPVWIERCTKAEFLEKFKNMDLKFLEKAAPPTEVE